MHYTNPEALVSTEWLAARLGESDLRVVDASWYLPDQNRDAAAEFETAHVPGAVRFDLDAVSDPDSPYPHMLPGPARFAEAATGLGIGNGDHVVVYDGMGLFSAPRAWWMFRVHGHERVSVLDGGFPKWRAEGHPVEAGPVSPEPASPPFAETFRPEMVRDIDAMRGNIGQSGSLVLDARGPARFRGEEPEPRPGVRGGHIPGSRNLHYAALTDPATNTLRGADELAALFRDSGARPGSPVVCTCGSGVTACALAFGLHLLGREDVAVYDGSWSEWGGRSDTRVETGG